MPCSTSAYSHQAEYAWLCDFTAAVVPALLKPLLPLLHVCLQVCNVLMDIMHLECETAAGQGPCPPAREAMQVVEHVHAHAATRPAQRQGICTPMATGSVLHAVCPDSSNVPIINVCKVSGLTYPVYLKFARSRPHMWAPADTPWPSAPSPLGSALRRACILPHRLVVPAELAPRRSQGMACAAEVGRTAAVSAETATAADVTAEAVAKHQGSAVSGASPAAGPDAASPAPLSMATRLVHAPKVGCLHCQRVVSLACRS